MKKKSKPKPKKMAEELIDGYSPKAAKKNEKKAAKKVKGK